MSPGCSPAASAGLSRNTPTISGPAVLGGIDPDADPDVGARQLLGSFGALLRRQERRVPGVADRIGQAFDRAIREGGVIELVGAHVVAGGGSPRPRRSGRTRRPMARRLGPGSCHRRRPTRATRRRPTPTPTLNVNTIARPVTTRPIVDPRPRSAAGDHDAWEGPSRTCSRWWRGSVVGSVGIGSGSVGASGSCRADGCRSARRIGPNA